MLLLAIILRRLPIVLTWATKAKVELKQLLIPLSFAALLGGTNTIIGERGGFIPFLKRSRRFQHSRCCTAVEQAQWQKTQLQLCRARRVPMPAGRRPLLPCRRSLSPPLPGTSTNLVVTGQFDSRVLNPSSPYYIEGGPLACGKAFWRPAYCAWWWCVPG